VCGLLAAPAVANSTTLHFFSKQVYSKFTGPTGKPLPPHTAPAPGDRVTFASDDYVGTGKHHAKRPTASDREDCTLTSPTAAICDGAIAIGGSMLFADNFTLNFSAKVTTVKITGGTGRYRHAHGTVVATTLKHGNDLKVTVS
jgi:hypothetical protein